MDISDGKSNSDSSNRFKPLRVWIPALLVPLMGAVRFTPDLVPEGPSMIWAVAAFGPMLVGLLILAWWLFLSRARLSERMAGLFGLVLIIVVVEIFVDHSMRDVLSIVMTIPMGIAGFAIGLLVLARHLSFRRTVFALILATLSAGFSVLLKNEGVWGDFSFGLEWRWKSSSEESFLADRESESGRNGTEAISFDPAALLNSEWPNFRGPLRNGVQQGVVFDADWESNPPKEIWRINLGPAWSSFSVAGGYLFTQEQRGENEAIVCYDAENGRQVWEQKVKSRFFDGLGGLGPRATPTIAEGSIYAMGAEGWLLKLDASSGEVIWQVDIREIAGREPPMWGFSSSPLVDNGIVSIHAAGKDETGILAFDSKTGDLKWGAAAGEMSYSSPQIITIEDRRIWTLLSNEGAHFLDPDSGETLLTYDWPHDGYRALQPQVVDTNKLLIPTGMGTGTRLIELAIEDGKLNAKELWTSTKLKPDFNDLVVHEGFAYGFDNSIFACINLQDGSQEWKGGRYGKGQVLLLSNSGLLVVVSESGKLVLLKATPESHEELYVLEAMSGKTWNHPVVVGDRLFVRNAEEAVCYQLPVAANVE